MKFKLFPLTATFILVTQLCYSQQQWFPIMKDRGMQPLVVDNGGAFPVSFIEFRNKKMYMCGYHTNYRTPMIFKNGLFFSHFLTIPIENKTTLYAKANYYFKIDGLKGRLTIKLKNKTDTINFIKSAQPFKEINGRWG